VKPITFVEQTCTYARNQPPYIPLPAYRTTDGRVIACWHMSWRERVTVLLTGRVWSSLMTFGSPPQPQLLQTNYPFERDKAKGEK
jgi:hypothetical protein